MNAPAIRLQSVDKRFVSGLLALQQVSMTVGRHEFVSLIGPSGCGKSTVLRLVAGLDRPTSGSIDAPAMGDANDIAGIADSAASSANFAGSASADSVAATAFVFQEPALMPWARVFDNVWLPLRLRGVSRNEAAPRVREVLRSVGLAEFEHSRPAQLSGGMKMRVSIARALVTRPRVLMMDEPFGALDDITRQRLNLDLSMRWQAAPMAVLFVTHNVFEAVFLSQRVLVMSSRPGRIVADIAVDEPFPRSSSIRTSAPFLAACARLSAALEATQSPNGAMA